MSFKRLAMKDVLMVMRKSGITSTLPVLNNVLIDGNTVTSTDLEVIVEAELDGDSGLYERLIPQDKLYKVLQKHNSVDDVWFTGRANSDVVTLNDRFDVESLDRDEYPEFPDLKDSHGSVRLSGKDAKRVFELGTTFAGTDEPRSCLMGMLLDGDAGYAVATDAHRLVRKDIPDVETFVDSSDAENFWPILSGKFVTVVEYALRKAKVDDDASVSIRFDDSLVEATLTGTRRGTTYRIMGRLVDEEYPDYWNVIPSIGQFEGVLRYNQGELEEELKVAREVGVDENTKRLILRDDGTLDGVGSRETLDYTYQPDDVRRSGDPCEIVVNADYLYEAVRRVRADHVHLSLISHDAPITIIDEDEVFIVMPLRKD